VLRREYRPGCPVLVGLKRRWMRCGLPASRPRDQDGERHWVCVIHSQYRGQLPFDERRDLLPGRNHHSAGREG
jgi:hypothetical protein